jgi:uncharacterized membrane protein YdfJ with MMPL/SSD domain
MELRLGLGAAVLIDAVIIRMALVPAVLLLIGKSDMVVPGPRAREHGASESEELVGVAD